MYIEIKFITEITWGWLFIKNEDGALRLNCKLSL